jgi:hypothetical protein
MPRATTDTTAVQRFDLETLPPANGEEGGWVELRKLSYGQILERRDMSAKMAIENVGARGATREEDMRVTTELIQKKVTEFEFKNCIVDHNLEDNTGRKLNLGDPRNVWALDPQVGQEISSLIDNLNQWDADLQGKEEKTFATESEQA